jgi:nicotinic acid phosphoribosyltransferase
VEAYQIPWVSAEATQMGSALPEAACNKILRMSSAPAADPFAAKRAAMRAEFFAKLFLLGGWLGGTDTYKRTMWAAVPDIAVARAGYALTMRKGLPEPGADNQLIMAGHEAMLAQWFHRPLRRADIELSRKWYSERSAVRAFPHELWDAILRGQPGEEIYLPVDVWGFPGGQTFLPGVPCLFFEGMGGAVSYLEPAMCRYFAPIIQATKGRLMKLATPRDAEFGLRAAPTEASNIILLLARYVGGRGRLTSNDTAEFLYPDLFQSVGTIGHEMMCAGQSFDRSLEEAEYEMMDRFVTRMGQASLLTDLVDAETVGLENALRVMRAHPETDQVGIRVDSGDLAGQCVLYFKHMGALGLTPRLIVFEDEVTPEVIRQVYDHFRKETGQEPTMLFPGAGGYWWRLVFRDTVAAAFKRSATGDHPNIKFSNAPGKESLPGYLRVYGRGDTLVVADASEPPQGEPLFVKLVEAGRIVYRERFEEQADRADRTWGRYKRHELSPKVHDAMARFEAMRAREVAEARERLERDDKVTR